MNEPPNASPSQKTTVMACRVESFQSSRKKWRGFCMTPGNYSFQHCQWCLFPPLCGQGNYSSRFSLLACTSIVKSMEEWQHPPAAWTTSSLDYYNELTWETGLEKHRKSTDKAAPFVLIQDIKVVQYISEVRGRLPCTLNSSMAFD